MARPRADKPLTDSEKVNVCWNYARAYQDQRFDREDGAAKLTHRAIRLLTIVLGRAPTAQEVEEATQP